jgi:putative protease
MLEISRGSLEVLSPAGSIEHVHTAIAAGADAVYIGIKGMSARPSPWSFDLSDAVEAARIVHMVGKRIHFALNAGYAEHHKTEVVNILDRLKCSDCDALIVGDWGLLKRIQNMGVQIPLHASSLLGVYNVATVRLLRQMGISRIILSTNLFLDEIAALIRESPGMEFELIAYGGVCFNDQCRCQLPHIVTDGHYRVGCQFDYIVSEDQDNQRPRTVDLHMPDVDLTSTLALYVAMGVTCFKIEGRTRSADYVAQSTAFLRKAVDDLLEGRHEANVSHYVIRRANLGVTG